MKRLFFIVSVSVAVISCNDADKANVVKTPDVLTDSAKSVAIADTANYTTIQWLDSTNRDLGQVKEGQIVEVTYRFKNSGSKPLVFASVSASCGCTVPEKPEGAIAPGEEGVIKAKFDSKTRKGLNSKDIYVVANTNPTTQSLNFKVNVE